MLLSLVVSFIVSLSHAGDRSSVDSERLMVNGRQVTSAARISRGVAYVKVDTLRSALASSRNGLSVRVDGNKLTASGGTISTGVTTIDGASYVPWGDVVGAAGGSLSGGASAGGTQAATVPGSCGSCIIDPLFIVDPGFIIDPGF